MMMVSAGRVADRCRTIFGESVSQGVEWCGFCAHCDVKLACGDGEVTECASLNEDTSLQSEKVC